MFDFESYESPIVMEIRNVAEKISEDRENQILATIQEECQLNINKQELIRALNYDRDQYKKGFEEAKRKFKRPKGEWIITSEDNNGIHRILCPFCKFEKGSNFMDHITVTFEKLPPFCECCGADMRGDKE